MRGISLLAEYLLASQEGNCFMEIISWLITWQVSCVLDCQSTFKVDTEERRTKRRRALMRWSGLLHSERCRYVPQDERDGDDGFSKYL